MLALRASNVAKEAMENGHNCCEAVLMASNTIWNLRLTDNFFASAKFFEGGMESGCTCGALVGMVMVSGILNSKYPHPKEKKLPIQLHTRFKQEFGSACCQVILKGRPFWQQLGKRACIDLTGKAISILVDEWEETINAEDAGISDYSDL